MSKIDWLVKAEAIMRDLDTIEGWGEADDGKADLIAYAQACIALHNALRERESGLFGKVKEAMIDDDCMVVHSVKSLARALVECDKCQELVMVLEWDDHRCNRVKKADAPVFDCEEAADRLGFRRGTFGHCDKTHLLAEYCKQLSIPHK